VFEQGWDDFVPYVCVAGAVLALAEGDHRRAALMAGVADAAFAALGQVPDPDDAAELASVRAATEEKIGAESFHAAYDRGRTLDPGGAFATSR
jgi:hypothetical protein